MSMEVAKVLYIVVVDTADEDKRTDDSRHSFRYTRSVLQITLQLMGCKARHAFKISKRVFEIMRTECRGDNLVTSAGNISEVDSLKVLRNHGEDKILGYISLDTTTKGDVQSIVQDHNEKNQPFELYKKRTTVVVNRDIFFDIVCNALMEYKYVGLNQRADLALACRIRERKESVTVLLCGTSGCGKSTLSALLASRLGITTVISTDSIRHMMRSFVDEKQNPLLWASTYHAGEHLDPIAVSEAKAKKKAKKSNPQPVKDDMLESLLSEKSPHSCTTTDLISPKQMAVEGYKAQSEMVIDSLDRLITAWEERKESVVVEGVHLSLNFVMGLMKKHPSIIPFMIYISNEEKHMERFAVRAKYMTLDPAKNKYVKYIRNIRTIQEYLCNRADKHLVPKINNTNVDRSVASIHATVFSCLRRRGAGDQVYDLVTNTVPVIDEEYRNQCAANSLSSKGMFQLIQRKGSSRHLMALLNIDGSVAKAWPVSSTDGKRVLESSIENRTRTTPMYGPLVIGKAEPVNLPFGNFGISAWPSDTGGTSHASSVDDLRGGDVTDNGSKYYSSCCSSPRMSEAPAKEPMEEDSVHGSDEDDDDSPEVGSDEDLSDDGVEKINEEVEGSVDEGSSKSDDEYDDLAIEENGYLSDDDEGLRNDDVNMVQTKGGNNNNNNEIDGGERYRQNLDLFLNSSYNKDECKQQPPVRSYSAFLRDRNERRSTSIGHLRNRKRSLSIPCLEERDCDFGERSHVLSGHLLN